MHILTCSFLVTSFFNLFFHHYLKYFTMETLPGWAYLLIFGGIVGWIAGLLMKGGGYGIIGNIVLGIVGSLVGGYLFDVLGISAGSGWLGQLIKGVIGAVVVIFIAGLFKGRR